MCSDIQIDRQTDLSDRRTERQTDRPTDRQTDRLIEWINDFFFYNKKQRYSQKQQILNIGGRKIVLNSTNQLPDSTSWVLLLMQIWHVPLETGVRFLAGEDGNIFWSDICAFSSLTFFVSLLVLGKMPQNTLLISMFKIQTASHC